MKHIFLILFLFIYYFGFSQTEIPLAGFRATLNSFPTISGDTMTATFTLLDVSNQFNGNSLKTRDSLVLWKNCKRYRIDTVLTSFATQVTVKLLKGGNPSLTPGICALVEENKANKSFAPFSVTDGERQCIQSYYAGNDSLSILDTIFINDSLYYVLNGDTINVGKFSSVDSIFIDSDSLYYVIEGDTVNVGYIKPDQTVIITGAGISSVMGTYPNFTITSTEVDGDPNNEKQTISQSFTGSTEATYSLNLSGGSVKDTTGYMRLETMDATAGQRLYRYKSNLGAVMGMYEGPGTGNIEILRSGNIMSWGLKTTGASNGKIWKYNGSAWALADDNVGTGTVTGTGSTGAIAFWSSSTGLSANTNFFWDNSAQRMGIRTNTPNAKLTIVGDNENDFLGLKNAGGTRTFRLVAGRPGSNNDGFSIYDDISGVNRMHINNSGLVAFSDLVGSGVRAVTANGSGELSTANLITGSGNNNYMIKWNGTTGLQNGLMYDNGTTVAMGTTSPTSNAKFLIKSSSPIFMLEDDLGARTWFHGKAGGTSNSFGIYSENSTAYRILWNASGVTTIPNLAGSGNRLILANSSGDLSPVTLGTGLSFSGSTLNGATGTVSGSGTTNAIPYWTSSTALGAMPVTYSTALPAVVFPTGNAIHLVGTATIIDKNNSYGSAGEVLSKASGGGVDWIPVEGTDLAFNTKVGTDVPLASSTGPGTAPKFRDGTNILLTQVSADVMSVNTNVAFGQMSQNNSSSVTLDGTFRKVPFDSGTLTNKITFSDANDRFTVTETGTYEINYSLTLNINASPYVGSFESRIYLNGTSVGETGECVVANNENSVSNRTVLSKPLYVSMTSGQYIELFYGNSSITTTCNLLNATLTMKRIN